MEIQKIKSTKFVVCGPKYVVMCRGSQCFKNICYL